MREGGRGRQPCCSGLVCGVRGGDVGHRGRTGGLTGGRAFILGGNITDTGKDSLVSGLHR